MTTLRNLTPAAVDDAGLLLVDAEKQLSSQNASGHLQGVMRGSFGAGEDENIVRIAHDTVPSGLHLLIEGVEADVGDEGADDPALGPPSSVARQPSPSMTPLWRNIRISSRMLPSAILR